MNDAASRWSPSNLRLGGSGGKMEANDPTSSNFVVQNSFLIVQGIRRR
jgi:hypothetical protein